MSKLLRHVLPKGFVKVRSYGLWSAQGAAKLQKARALLSAPQTASSSTQIHPLQSDSPEPSSLKLRLPSARNAKSAILILAGSLLPQYTRGP